MPEPEGPLNPVVPLTGAHEIADFDCGKPALNEFLVKYALQNQAGGGARTYVLTRGHRVIAYYSLAPASVSPEDAPERVMKGQGRYPVPAVLMARFAVDLSEQRKGYGKALLRDAVRRALSGAEIIGGRVFLVHAKDNEARAFYLKHGMEESPTNPLHLLWLFKDIRKSLEGAGGPGVGGRGTGDGGRPAAVRNASSPPEGPPQRSTARPNPAPGPPTVPRRSRHHPRITTGNFIS